MATNEILTFAATDNGTNLLTQAEYNADSQRPIGNQPGVARSKLVNKAMRQSSLIASAIAQFLANRQSNNITDSLTPATIAGYMETAISNLLSGAFLGVGYMLLKDEKPQGTHAGASVIGIQTRTLNTVAANTIVGASLASNQITLPAGTYRVTGRAPAFVNSTKGFLYNVTDSVNQIIGYNYNGITGANSDQSQSDAMIDGRFTISGTKVFEFRQYCSEETPLDGLGAFVGQGVEVYTTIEIIKEA